MDGTHASYELLAIFTVVAEQSSFTHAAKKLGIGKGTVSRAIAQLERRLGAELIHRTTHAVSLSTAGAALYERTAHHLAALDEAILDLPERALVPSGELRLTAPFDFGLSVLPDMIAQFALRYPDVRFDVRLTNERIDLVAEGFDAAIRGAAGSLRDSTLTARRLGSSEFAFYAAPTYVARRGSPTEPGDARHDWIVYPKIPTAKLPRKMTRRFVCDDILLARELARDGAGIALLPRFVANPHVRTGLLEEIGLGAVRAHATLYFVYPSSGQVPRKVSAFRDFVIARLKASPLG